MEKTKILYIIIAILIVIIAGLLWNSWYNRQIFAAQQSGYNIGLQNSIISIIQQSRNCQPVSLFAGNQTFNFIDVACLRTNEQLSETKQ
ncbi:hypothetical protein HYU07_00240 [Candidatus Woesearchaeota archaeon]|nr:hypothetical protein [Candidatus Woesearchaeota archaeon]